MRPQSRLLFVALLLTVRVAAQASTPIATVTSPEPFSLDGQLVSTAGAVARPFALGNEVATANAPAILFFQDGSSVKLAPHSRAKLAGSEALPKLILLAGSLDYKLVLGSNLSVTKLDFERQPATHSD